MADHFRPRRAAIVVGTRAWIAGVGAIGFAIATGCAAAAPEESFARAAALDRAPLRVPPPHALVPGGSVRLVFKAADLIGARLMPDGTLDAREPDAIVDLHEVLARYDLALRSVFDLPPTRIEALQSRALANSGRTQPDLLATFAVAGEDVDPEVLLAAAWDLWALPEVEYAAFETLRAALPVDIAPPTPALDGQQGYAQAAQGVNAVQAHADGIDGTGVRIADIEYNWLLQHEEFNDVAVSTEAGQTPDEAALAGLSDGNHGLAVLGVAVGPANGYGVTGLAPGSHAAVYPTLTLQSGSRRAAAIASAASDSADGDILLLEMQAAVTPGEDDYGPAELDPTVWMATRVAVDAGVVVVGAAGNGSVDLDRPDLQSYRDRGDSGAIIVGAGAPNDHAALGFSSYGTRVDVQGWGTAVTTTGYGALATYGGDVNQTYTDSFNGTSSASPVVAGTAALVQQAAKEETGAPLSSEQMREILQVSGTPQGGGGQIGPLPRAPLAIAAAQTPKTAPPELTIDPPATTVTEAPSLQATLEVLASPDTVQVQLAINGEPQAVVDDEPPFVFADATFPEGTWSITAIGRNVWGNEAESDPIIVEVGVEPPTQDGSTGETPGSDEDADGVDPIDDGIGGTDGGDAEPGGEPGERPALPGWSAPRGSGEPGCGCRATTSRHGSRWTWGTWGTWSLVIAARIGRRRRPR